MKFSIKELGKIKSADFEIKDLTIFVGKNSTNKSYAAHTVYMLNKILSEYSSQGLTISAIMDDNLFELFIKDNADKFKDFKNSDSSKNPIIIDNIEDYNLGEFIKSAKKFFEKDILHKINESFNSNKIILQSIKLNTNPIKLQKTISYKKNSNDYINTIFQEVYFQTLKSILESFNKIKIAKKVFFFPASRTGFILAFDEIISGLLRNKFGNKITSTKLTAPTIDFLLSFYDIKNSTFNISNNLQESKIKNILEFIENRLLKGKILEESNNLNSKEFYFKPKDSDELELFLTSSSTVEMLPLVVFLQNIDSLEDKLLIIEEPEAHLHPQAQIEIARVIVMLVNAGAKVLITTHSDYIISEINNCIKLSNINKEFLNEYLKEYKLNKDIIISKNKVSTYIFKDTTNSVKVEKLNTDNYGIYNDNFDEILDELLDRSQKLNENVKD